MNPDPPPAVLGRGWQLDKDNALHSVMRVIWSRVCHDILTGFYEMCVSKSCLSVGSKGVAVSGLDTCSLAK